MTMQPNEYLTEAGLEAHNRFHGAVAKRATEMTSDYAKKVMGWYGKNLPRHGVHYALVEREAAKLVLAA